MPRKVPFLSTEAKISLSFTPAKSTHEKKTGIAQPTESSRLKIAFILIISRESSFLLLIHDSCFSEMLLVTQNISVDIKKTVYPCFSLVVYSGCPGFINYHQYGKESKLSKINSSLIRLQFGVYFLYDNMEDALSVICASSMAIVMTSYEIE